jgi:hypothetical protein
MHTKKFYNIVNRSNPGAGPFQSASASETEQAKAKAKAGVKARKPFWLRQSRFGRIS